MKKNVDCVPNMKGIRDFYVDNILDIFEILKEQIAFQLINKLINKLPGLMGKGSNAFESLERYIRKSLEKAFQ